MIIGEATLSSRIARQKSNSLTSVLYGPTRSPGRVPWLSYGWCVTHNLRIVRNDLYWLEIPIIRNAGGRARGAVFDIAILDSIIEITEVVIIHHTSRLSTRRR
jgi:hypothetical protein